MEKQLTQEQLDIINISKKMQKNESLKIQAYAGSGKTSTLLEIAKANPNQSFLYLAFNKSIIEEAKKKFPQNVNVKTTHSLAYSRIIGQGNFKVVNKHDFEDYQELLGIKDYNDFIVVNQTLNEFLNSSKKEFPYQWIANLFEATRQKRIPYTHSMYLKEFQLLKPEARGLDQYNFILLDEAQDTNAVTLDIFTENQCKKILVGDTFQNIYGFRETINALKEINTTYSKKLTYSFRSNQTILNKASYFLNQYQDENTIIRSAYEENQRDKKTKAIITRTNAGIIQLIAKNINAYESSKYKLIKEPESLFSSCINCYYLKNKQQYRMNKEFKWLANLSEEELNKYAQKDIELSNALKIVDKYGSEIFEFFEEAKQMFKNKDFETSITNAHISKGLEWNKIILYEDFPCLRDLKYKILEEKDEYEQIKLQKQLKEETNLYYVALTRAKDLVIDKTKNSFEYSNFLTEHEKSETKEEILKKDNEEQTPLKVKRNLKRL